MNALAGILRPAGNGVRLSSDDRPDKTVGAEYALGRMVQSEDEIAGTIARLFAQELGVDEVGLDTHFIFTGGDFTERRTDCDSGRTRILGQPQDRNSARSADAQGLGPCRRRQAGRWAIDLISGVM